LALDENSLPPVFLLKSLPFCSPANLPWENGNFLLELMGLKNCRVEVSSSRKGVNLFPLDGFLNVLFVEELGVLQNVFELGEEYVPGNPRW